MAQNPKYDNDLVNLGYLKKKLAELENSSASSESQEISQAKNYSAPPVPPYYKDSLLCYNGKIYRCNTDRNAGVFSWDDWSIAATDDTAVNNFIDSVYEVDKIEIQEQIDQKMQSYYQDNDPALDWATDLEKSKHVGDYWTNTTDNTQWRYSRNTNVSPISYYWSQVSVPNAIFDLIDKKKSIYTSKPTNYCEDDMWIIEETISDDDLPIGDEDNPISRGDWVFATIDSENYDKTHWRKRDENVDIEYIEEHYYTKGETDLKFSQVDRNVDSKITQAKDEINLQVKEGYTTKEEYSTAIFDFDEKIGEINETIITQGETISQISVETGRIKNSVEETIENLDIVSNRVDNIQTSTDQTIKVVEDIKTNGVSQVHTETGYTFDKDGLHIDKTGSPVGSELDEAGLEIEDKTGSTNETQFYGGYITEELAEKTPELEKFLNQTATYSKNILFKQFLMSLNWRQEEVEDEEHGIGYGFFYVGDDSE